MFKMNGLLLLILITAIPAFAQVPFILGEHEGFLGNTGIARLGSSAAGYYNPAGLATVESRKLSATGTLFQYGVTEVGGSTNGRSTYFLSIPTQVSTVGKLGEYRW